MPKGHYSLPGKPTSLWLDTTPDTDFPPLQEDLSVDVVIIGGGVVGLTAATLLKEEGKTVAVLEAARIVQGVTGYTTAKITSLHTLIYDHLIRHFGDEKAQAYAAANQAAIEQIAAWVREKNIDCDFARTEAYTYATKDDDVDQLDAELEAALKLGLPATLVHETSLPFPIKAAIRFGNQAHFHPRKYLLALADKIPGAGSHIFEKTKAISLTKGEPCVVKTERGSVSARDVIIASHFPFNDKALYSPRLHVNRSYVLAVRVAEPVPHGMYISTEQPSHSIRHHPTADGGLLLIGGEGHTAGEGDDTEARYQRLEQWARARFDVQSVEYRWSTQDNQTIDRIPYIGRAAPFGHHVYVATGFGGWGMTNGTAGGVILRDLIVGHDNPWASVYNPNRINMAGVSAFLKQQADVARHFVGDRIPEGEPESVAPGEGKIVKSAHGKVAMHKSKDGTVHTLSAACTHMGCFVQWNPAEQSWDCPCHGSRFAIDGKVIQGPATKDLKKIDAEGR